MLYSNPISLRKVSLFLSYAHHITQFLIPLCEHIMKKWTKNARNNVVFSPFIFLLHAKGSALCFVVCQKLEHQTILCWRQQYTRIHTHTGSLHDFTWLHEVLKFKVGYECMCVCVFSHSFTQSLTLCAGSHLFYMKIHVYSFHSCYGDWSRFIQYLLLFFFYFYHIWHNKCSI